MNETTLETQLRSLKPRQPSAKIKQRLQSGTGVPPVRLGFRHALTFLRLTGGTPVPLPELARLVRWFAPTVACGLIALAALHQEGLHRELNSRSRSSRHFSQGEDSNIAGVTINRSPDFFEWTNRSGSAFNVRSFLPGTTN